MLNNKKIEELKKEILKEEIKEIAKKLLGIEEKQKSKISNEERYVLSGEYINLVITARKIQEMINGEQKNV